MARTFKIGDRMVGGDNPCYIIAEISCNHDGDFEEARKIIEESAKAGVDALKLQTYTPDTMTRDFKTKPKGTIWEDMDLHSLYQKAYTPWDWHKELAKIAADNGVHLFSTPFDETAVDFLMEQDVPVMKIASYEAVDTKLIEKVAKTGLPVIISNGMTDFLEMKEAVDTLRAHGCEDISVLHCNSGYPAAFDEVFLANIPVIGEMFDVVPGLSDHTIYADVETCNMPMAHVTPVESMKFGTKIIELHVMLDREKGRAMHAKNEGGFDWPFSREPAELKKMIDMVREYERSGTIQYDNAEEEKVAQSTHGTVNFEPTKRELNNRPLRPSLWAVRDVKKGESFFFAAETDKKETGNFDSIRPGGGLHVRYADYIEGKIAARDIEAGQPISWDMIETNPDAMAERSSRAVKKSA